ncbi:uncharacterized protein LOC129591961 [Paramacrobiotus metropolitanus]|uniref:uncharacterized protein LOC129591961 n=1 Tax=Paramacrobiotus metropolitanus TaxID=2943436 RepID=UPI00244566E5|nr:uncharacterized protein LOC129591961 [Paramacrobiotus metropolitanus]
MKICLAVSTFLFLSYGTSPAKGDLFCHVCNSITQDTITACPNESQYTSRNCTSLLPRARFCVILNGNYTTVTSKHPQTALGPRRTCQFDLDRYEIFDTPHLQPGCREVNITKTNYLAFDYFHFDGQICLCDEDNCNTGDRGVMRTTTRTPRGRNTGHTLVVIPAFLVFALAVLLGLI